VYDNVNRALRTAVLRLRRGSIEGAANALFLGGARRSAAPSGWRCR